MERGGKRKGRERRTEVGKGEERRREGREERREGGRNRSELEAAFLTMTPVEIAMVLPQ